MRQSCKYLFRECPDSYIRSSRGIGEIRCESEIAGERLIPSVRAKNRQAHMVPLIAAGCTTLPVRLFREAIALVGDGVFLIEPPHRLQRHLSCKCGT
jgi:hypothetical protein